MCFRRTRVYYLNFEMAAKVADSSNTMLAAYVTEWLEIGTVPDKVSFGNVPAPASPQKNRVLIDVKAASINVSDIALLQDTGAGGWCYHTRGLQSLHLLSVDKTMQG